MATRSLDHANDIGARRGRIFARLLTAACAVTAVVLLGAGLYLMAMGSVAAAQSKWVSAEVQCRMIGPVFVTLGVAFFFAAMHRSLRSVRSLDRDLRGRRTYARGR